MNTVEKCVLNADGTVTHMDCHTYTDGTVTDPKLKLPEYIVTGGVR